MKQFNNCKIILLVCFFVAGIYPAQAQNQIASSSFSWQYANGYINFKSSQGTVCNPTNAAAYNYNLAFGQPSNPGGVHFNDSAGITNLCNNTPTANRFKATAGRVDTITVIAYVANNNQGGGVFINSIQGAVECRVGTYARTSPFGTKNLLFDNTVIVPDPAVDPAVDNFGVLYTYKIPMKFKRGSKSGHVFITIPIKDYAGQMRYEEFILPFLVFGALDEEVPHLGTTTEPKIPYMVLHDPPGDNSSASLSTTVQSCRSMEETYSTDASNNVFGTVKLGLKGSVGVIATVDYEIFAEFSAGATIGNIKMGATSKESCISITNTTSTSSLDPGANASDLFIGYGMDLYYGVSDNIEDSACTYRYTKGLIYTPVDGTTVQFVYTKQEILDDIAAQQASLNLPGVTPKDSAKALYQIDIWNQVLALNDSNIANASGIDPDANFGSGGAADYSKTIDVSQSHTLSVEHYVDAEVGLQGVVNIAGSGFSAGYKYTTSKRFGESNSSSSQTSQTMSYHLADDDAGDIFHVQIQTDPMYGTPVFKIKPTSKTSCPYEGGVQRDQPRLEHLTTTDSLITFPNVAIGDFQSFDLKVANNSAEARAYRLRLKNNINNAVVTVAGNAGPEFTPVTGIQLGAKGSGTDVVIYRVDVRQLNPNSLSFPALEFELYDACSGDVTASVFATVNYGTLVKSMFSGSWNTVSTWEAGRVPQPTDSVIINNNHVITVPAGLDLKCKAITLNSNSNLIVPQNTKLTIKGN